MVSLMRVLDTLGRAFTGSVIGMALLDLEGRWLEVNPALCRLLGRSPEELTGRSVLDVTHPEDREASADRLGALAAGDDRLTFEQRYVRSDGGIVWARVLSAVAHDADGRVEAVFTQIEDLTAHRQAEQLLRSSDERFARVFEDAPLGMTLNSARPREYGRVLRVNAAFCRIMRAPADELVGILPATYVHPDDIVAASDDWFGLLDGRLSAVSRDRRFVRPDGSVFLGRNIASLVRDDDGEPLYVVSQVQDVTESLEAERRFRFAFEDAAVAMALYGVDLEIQKVNRALCRLTGYEEHELIGRSMRDLVRAEGPAGEGHEAALLLGAAAGPGGRELLCARADGGHIWTYLTASPVPDDEGRTAYVVAQIEDVTAERGARRAAEQRLAQQTAAAWLGQRALTEEDLGAIFDAAVGLVATTCEVPYAALAERCPDGRLRLVATVGWPWRGTVLDGEATASHAAYTMATGGPVIVEDAGAEGRFSTAALTAHGVASGMSVLVAGETEGAEPFGALTVHSTQGRVFTSDDIAFLTSIAGILSGSIRRFAAARSLRHQSLHDPLTHLPNRALLLDRLRQAMARSRRDGSTVAVLFCDMDDFKYVNDTLGHEAGDRLLRELAPRLQSALRTTDTLARFGGDEFVVLCEGLTDPSEVIAVADRLLEACKAPIDLGRSAFVPTASIGIALATPESASDPEALLRDADAAMYRAKSRGKGRYELFDAAMRTHTLERAGLLADLRHAVSRAELVLEFQPIVSLQRRQLAGLEGLVRWHHADRGLLMPDQFIALAQDEGLIHDLGRWVIDEAVRCTADWREREVPVLAGAMTGVNVSWRQIAQGTLVEDVRQALERHGLDPAAFCVEVTETAVLEDPERAAEALSALRQLGVHLVLDDFGTGQSSLALLREFPFHTLKLDRSFLASGDWDIVRAVSQMARGFDLLVVAEGIERLDQQENAAQLGCDFGQGWLYGRAVAAPELERTVGELAVRLRA